MNKRIGIVIKGFKCLANWELRLIQYILNNQNFELAVLVQEEQNPKPVYKLYLQRLLSKNGLSKALLALQLYIEKRMFFKDVISVDKNTVIAALNTVPIFKMQRQKSDAYPIIAPEELDKITDQNLHVVLNLGLNRIPKEILHVPTYGVWDFMFKDYTFNECGPAGFWEVAKKKSGIGFTLLKSTPNEQDQVLDSSYFNRGWSAVETATIVQEGAVSVILKNLKELQNKSTSAVTTLPISSKIPPNSIIVIKYIFGFYNHLAGKFIEKIRTKFFGVRYTCWSLFLGKGSFLDSRTLPVKPLEMPKDEFWADPFVFQFKDKHYVFFENYSYKTKRGKISCGLISGEKLVDIVDVLDFDYHLSYPFIFEENGAIFLMPETAEAKRLEIFRATDFPLKWELYTTAFEGESVADAHFFKDSNNQNWLFINKQAAETAPMNSELFIYKTDSVKMQHLQSHAQNPVIIDARVARNGGAIFVHNDMVFRPSQRNTDGVYGRALNINRIKKLTIDEYIEENLRIEEPSFDKDLIGMHHLHQTNDYFVFDACYNRK